MLSIADALQSLGPGQHTLEIAERGIDGMPFGSVVTFNPLDVRPSPPGPFVIDRDGGLIVRHLEVVPNSAPLRVRIVGAEGESDAFVPVASTRIHGRVTGAWRSVT